MFNDKEFSDAFDQLADEILKILFPEKPEKPELKKEDAAKPEASKCGDCKKHDCQVKTDEFTAKKINDAVAQKLEDESKPEPKVQAKVENKTKSTRKFITIHYDPKNLDSMEILGLPETDDGLEYGVAQIMLARALGKVFEHESGVPWRVVADDLLDVLLGHMKKVLRKEMVLKMFGGD